MRSARFFLLSLTASLVLLSLGFAQSISGDIRGLVKDSSGAVVANAAVTVTNLDQNTVLRTLTTGSSGEYVAALLPVGTYKITVTAANFATTSVTSIRLNVNDRVNVDVTMKVSGQSQTVEVQADAVRVDTVTTAAQGLITGTQVRELSLNNRNYEQLVALQPGVSANTTDQIYVGVSNYANQTNVTSFAVNGGRNSGNNWTVDGADNVDRGSNLTLLSYPSVDSIEEFKVLRGQYDAEFGRSASGQINVVTKSGTSSFHGSGYEFFRNDVLNANDFISNRNGNPKPPLRYNNFGWTLGGPLYIPGVVSREKSQTFFFFSQEFRRIHASSNAITSAVPNANERLGIFSQPVCGDAACSFTTTTIAPNPIAQAYINDIFSKLPVPQDPVNDLLSASLNSTFNFRQEIVKIDHNFGNKLNLSFRYSHDDIPTVEDGGLFTGNSVPGLSTTQTNAPGRILTVHGTSTLTSTFLNEIGYSYSHGAIESTPIGLVAASRSPNAYAAAAAVLPYAIQLARVPQITFDDGAGAVGFGQYRDYNRNRNIYDNITKVWGNHTMKFGFSYNHYEKDENDAGGFNTNVGSFNFSDPTGNGVFQQEWAQFLLGNSSGFSQSSRDAHARIRQNQYEVYGQDSWRFNHRLTLTLGARYSLFRQPTEVNNQINTFNPAAYNPSAACNVDRITGTATCLPGQNPFNGVLFAGHAGYGNAVLPTPKDNIAPRVGFAYDPSGDGKSSIRAGFGLFYDSPSVSPVETTVFNQANIATISTGATSLLNPTSGGALGSIPYLLTAGPGYKTPYTEQWSLDYQRDLGGGTLIDIGYYGNQGRHLPGNLDVNQPLPGSALAAGILPAGGYLTTFGSSDPASPYSEASLNAIRPYVGYEAINQIKNIYTSNYNGLQTQMTKKFKGNSLLVANYTWSKALGRGNNTSLYGDCCGSPQNTYNLNAEYGRLALDRRHIFTFNYVYALPFFEAQRGFLGHAAGGWELSGILTAETGLPFQVRSRFRDYAGTGTLGNSYATQRADVVVQDPNAGQPHTFDNFITKADFANPSNNLPGNSRPNIINGPGIVRLDFSAFKNIKITERLGMQFRAEAFNILNHTNFNSFVSTRISSSSFYKVASVRDPRIMQLALKVTF